MAINKATPIVVKGDQLLDATIVASLAISLSGAGVTHMHKMLGPKVRAIVSKAVAIRAVIMVMVMVIGRLVSEDMLWMPMSSRGIRLVSLKGINQDHLVIMSIRLTRLSQKTEFRNCSL